MSTRRILLAVIAFLSLTILVGGGGLVALVLWLNQSSVPAQLLVLDANAQLRLLNADGQEQTLVTDASTDIQRYPAIAPDGEHIAYITQNDNGNALFKLHMPSGDRTELYRSRENTPLYITWSPDGRYISFLNNLRDGRLGMHIVAADGTQESELIGAAQRSSFFSWNPTGRTLLFHLDGSSFNGGQMITYQPGVSSAPELILDDPGFFQAPAWSTDGSYLYYVAQPVPEGTPRIESVESVLTRITPGGEGATVLARERQAVMLFSRAPQSDHIAYISVNLADPPADIEDFGPLKVVDVETGARATVSQADDKVVAFFWSPDGEQLAYLTKDTDEAEPGRATPRHAWHVVSRLGGDTRRLVDFVPSLAFDGMVSFFDAYAKSFSLWSPDSQYLTYGADDGIYVIDVANGTTRRETDGILSLWVGQSR